jgi:hypothetical protein
VYPCYHFPEVKIHETFRPYRKNIGHRNLPQTNLRKDYETAFCSVLALGKKVFKNKPIFEVFGLSLTLK